MNRWRGALPVAVLAAEVLVFYRHVLFYGGYVLPWDMRAFHLPLAEFLAQSLRRGEFPLWDPFTYCGVPFYANVQAQVFYPPTILTVWLSNLAGGSHLLYFLEWQLVLHVFLSGALTYRLLLRLDAGRHPALLGATVFQLGGFFASQAQHLGAVNGAAWLPLAWLSVLMLGRGFRWRWTAALGLSLALSFLAGLPAVAIAVAVSSGLLAVILVAFRRAPARLLGPVALAGVWSVLMAAAQLLPTLELNGLSVAQYRSDWLGTGGGLPLASLVSLLLPNYYGIFDLATYSRPWEPTFLHIYCGIPGLLLAIWAAFRRTAPVAAPFAVLTVLLGIWMLGDSTPAGKALALALPASARGAIHPEFVMPACLLGVAVLAGLGAHPLLSGRPRWMGAALVAVAAADLIAVGSGRNLNTVSLRREPGVTATHFDGDREVLAGVRAFVGTSEPPWRIDTVEDSMSWATAAPLTRIPTANGNDPFAIARLIAARGLFTGGERWGRYYQVTDPDSPVLAMMSVRYLLSRSPVKSAAYTKVKEFSGRALYENRSALPRFYFAREVEHARNQQEALSRLRDRRFDPHRTAVVEGTLAATVEGSPAALPPVRVSRYHPALVRLETDSPSTAFLASSETYYPGWRAFVDGIEQPLVLTNVAFRGLTVPAGRHTVEMRFEPRILRTGIATSLAGLALLLAALLFGDNGAKRPAWISSNN